MGTDRPGAEIRIPIRRPSEPDGVRTPLMSTGPMSKERLYILWCALKSENLKNARFAVEFT